MEAPGCKAELPRSQALDSPHLLSYSSEPQEEEKGICFGGSGPEKMLLLPTSGSQGALWSHTRWRLGGHATLPPGILATTCILSVLLQARLHVGTEASQSRALSPRDFEAGGLAHF